MANVKTEYGTEAQTLTITLASLADNTAREAAYIDNRTNKFLEITLYFIIKLAAGTPANEKAVNIYVAGTVDLTTPRWPDAVTGSDAAITMNSPTQLYQVGQISAPTSAGTFNGQAMVTSKAWAGTVPQGISVIVQNKTGITFDSTESNHKKLWQGDFASSV